MDESTNHTNTGTSRVSDPPFNPFYITGLPRSRTAWLSVALSDWRQSACLHEPLPRWPDTSPETVTAELSKTRTPYAGISDCGLPILSPDLPALLPGPVLVVWREPADVLQSLERFLPTVNPDEVAGMLALAHQRLAEFCKRYASVLMQVRFGNLAEDSVMRAVWHHLLPGTKFQSRRVRSLQRLRIDPDPDQLLDGTLPNRLTEVKELLPLLPLLP